MMSPKKRLKKSEKDKTGRLLEHTTRRKVARAYNKKVRLKSPEVEDIVWKLDNLS